MTVWTLVENYLREADATGPQGFHSKPLPGAKHVEDHGPKVPVNVSSLELFILVHALDSLLSDSDLNPRDAELAEELQGKLTQKYHQLGKR